MPGIALRSDRPTRQWALTSEAFGRLLGQLGDEPEVAGREYDAIRRRLVTFFQLRGGGNADALADEAIDRVARRLDEGEKIEHVRAYFFGVARYVLLEETKRRYRETSLAEAPAAARHADDSEAIEVRAECLERCLATLSTADRELIVAYYEGPGVSRLADRRRLAERLGLSDVALRTRAHRIRNRLEACLRCRLDGPSHGSAPR